MLKKLGRGLDSLIEATAPRPIGGEDERREIPCSSIRPNPHQPREILDDEAIRELADSIRQHGILQPLLVRPADDGYELVAGERRWRASRLLGRETVPVVVRRVTDDQMLEIALVENLQREDLNAIEKARAYRRFLTELALTHEEAARRRRNRYPGAGHRHRRSHRLQRTHLLAGFPHAHQDTHATNAQG